ncbi:MAG TPA: monofunctional biosynthetic peptidoglycan transglycosylase [Bacteroidia bacterium]|jgi:monofunctional biosynthetic peptidoglycan transglycosylase|nr:monofunctional biosynthetic peptidoglycan transglycosylase [Bacteroidia bacterium]HQF29669.1 monofunctional biosynthetic peptidoglycan transglycosylase [Bacteroidia bacterium]HQK97976.1 monofunctional biosynthetic peptidoglycan transglycosylase [Bacteroidia bacterium]
MLKKVVRTIAYCILGFVALSFISTLIFRWVPIPATPLMVIRYFEMEDGKIDKTWKPLSEINSSLPLAVVTSEDQKFEDHFGFDIEAIEKAAKYNQKHKGGKVKGASTISQQTAKNVFLWPSRSWIRKGFEVYFTFVIEVCWSKERIMEVYLNVIEMGPGVYGAEAAAQYYFHKPASQLTREQSALIAAILPNPIKWSAAKPTPYISRKKAWILQHMRKIELKEI